MFVRIFGLSLVQLAVGYSEYFEKPISVFNNMQLLNIIIYFLLKKNLYFFLKFPNFDL